jgi:hypothetical protein
MKNPKQLIEQQQEVKILRFIGKNLISGHLLEHFTHGKTYKADPINMGGKIINHYIVGDDGKKVLLSAKAKRKFFIKNK